MSLLSPKSSISLTLLVLWAANIGIARAATSTRQFREWYPQYGWIFRNITLTNCSDEYERYLTGYKNHSEIDYLGGGGIYTALTQPVINCILNHTSEYLKGCMTGSQVLLGIMPTVLALLGPSHNEIALLANVGRRPLLALGLALSSPSTYFGRAFEYSDPKEIMSHHKNRRQQRCPKGRAWQLLITCVEYALTAGACFNAVNNSIQVGTMSISSVMSDFDFFAVMWLFDTRRVGTLASYGRSRKGSDPQARGLRHQAQSLAVRPRKGLSASLFLGVVVHICSCFVLRLRLQGWRDPTANKCEQRGTNTQEKRSPRGIAKSGTKSAESFWLWIKGTWPRMKEIFYTEFFPCAAKQYDVRIVTFQETKTFLVAAWWESTLTILHVVFGTLIFSSLLFMGVKDALSVVGRYMASVALCRVILMYELAGLRERCITIDGEKIKRNVADIF